MEEKVECWHFLPDNGRMWNDRSILVEPGVTYAIEDEPILCQRGFHGARMALDAIQYAQGALCCRVEIGGVIKEEEDKLVGQSRKVLWMADATRTLHLYACDVAEEALTRAQITDPVFWQCIETKRRWLDGQATTQELEEVWRKTERAAARVAARRAAARAAVWASRAARWEAAEAATRAAIGAATWSAARAAAEARVAARAAAGAAEWEAEWSHDNTELESRLYALKPIN